MVPFVRQHIHLSGLHGLLSHCFTVCLIFVTMASSIADTIAGKRPNIIVILTDDQGYGDISAHGNPILKTPNLDRLRSSSIRFTDFHVSPTCAPTRSALMTGRHEFKNGVTHTILERERLTPTATTLAKVIQDAGYRTGIFGKWHLGDEEPYRPYNRGFDEVLIHGAGGIGQSYAGSCGDAPNNTYQNPVLLHNGQFEKTDGYCTDVFFSSALRWIESQKDTKQGSQNVPFFAWIATNAPHSPYIAKDVDREVYSGKVPNAEIANFYGMIHNIDQNVGLLLDKLEQWQLRSNTLVIFMNDNGGTAGVPIHNAQMRGAKNTAWLGGTRASCFWSWPQTLQPADCDALTAHIDLFPTLVEITDATPASNVRSQFDGRSLVPLLENAKSHWPDRTLFTHIGRWPKGAQPDDFKFAMCSVRTKQWQLISPDGNKSAKWQLFHIPSDPSQSKNVAEENSEVVQDLANRFDFWWRDVKPMMVNEDAPTPSINAFKELYMKQFGNDSIERPK